MADIIERQCGAEARHQMTDIFQASLAPICAEAQVGAQSIAAGCQLHTNMVADIDTVLERRHPERPPPEVPLVSVTLQQADEEPELNRYNCADNGAADPPVRAPASAQHWPSEKAHVAVKGVHSSMPAQAAAAQQPEQKAVSSPGVTPRRHTRSSQGTRSPKGDGSNAAAAAACRVSVALHSEAAEGHGTPCADHGQEAGSAISKGVENAPPTGTAAGDAAVSGTKQGKKRGRPSNEPHESVAAPTDHKAVRSDADAGMGSALRHRVRRQRSRQLSGSGQLRDRSLPDCNVAITA